MLRIPKNQFFKTAIRFKSRDIRVDYVVLVLERIEIEMAAFGNLSLMTLFPITLLLLTMEIVLASYKSLSPKWTAKLAYGNLIINAAWTILIIILLLNPSLVLPHLADVIADVFQRSPDDIIPQVRLIIIVIGLASIATTIIDAFSGFRKLRTENGEVNEVTRE
ncbi:hypothetical protein [Sporosarcina koreensis]|uniref:Uncharacterized protein n=1 Tax=Sporosarcina koreensis TaxID=334735 RepID=A0ABW0TZM9_9BACL